MDINRNKVFIAIILMISIFVYIFYVSFFKNNKLLLDSDNIFSKDGKDIIVYLDKNNDDIIDKLNKYDNAEILRISKSNENDISKFKNFYNLNKLILIECKINNLDSEKISKFNSLKELIVGYSNINFDDFNYNSNISYISLYICKIKNFEILSKCVSLKTIIISGSLLDNYIINKDGYILEDSSIFSDFDNIINLTINVDEIQDISGILEMDSLENFCVNRDSISEEDVKSLANKGITVTYCDKNE